MKPAAVPALALAGIAATYLVRAYAGGRLPFMEAPIIIAAAFNAYFYAGYLVALLFGAAPGRRLGAALGVPAAVFLLLFAADLFSGPSSGGWINLRLRFRHFWALPGFPVYSLLSMAAGAAKMRTPLREMRGRNIDVDLMAAVARPDGGLVAAALFDAGQKTVSGVVRLSPEGEPAEDGAPRDFPYFLVATPQPDRTLVVNWAEPYATLAMTIDENGATAVERFDDLATKITGVGPPGGWLRDRAGRLLRLGRFVVGDYPGRETHLVRLLPGGRRDESFVMPECREGAQRFHPLPSGGFLIQFGPDAEAPVEEYDAEGRLLRALDKIGQVTAVSVRSDGAIFAATANMVFRIGPSGMPEETFPANGPVEAIHAEPDGAVVAVRGERRPRIEKYRAGGEPDGSFNHSVGELAAEGDELRLLTRLDSGELVVAARQPGQGSRLYWIAPDGRVIRRREY